MVFFDHLPNRHPHPQQLGAYVSCSVNSTHGDLVAVGIPAQQLTQATCRSLASVGGKMRDLRDAVIASINTEQRNINRCLLPAVQQVVFEMEG
jgi:hypothetical protein